MAWSGGTYTRSNGVYTGSLVWQSDAAASVKILATRHDTHDQDLADGISACIHKGGQNSPTANISWGSKKITSLANGSDATDAATYGQTITAASFDGATDVLTLTRSVGNLTVDLTGAVKITAFDVTGTASASTFLRGDGTWGAAVTSVAVANAVGITWSGSPITGSGTLTPTLSANLQSWSGIAPSDKAGSTGSGASGTWGISITGNAATASAVAWSGISSKPTTISGYGITDGVTNVSGVASIRKMTQAAYDALGSKDANTLYVIVG